MSFSSPAFLFFFLPLAWCSFHVVAGLFGAAAARVWLLLVSLGFYAAGEPASLPLLFCSVAFNFAWGRWLTSAPENLRGTLLFFGVAANLGYLAWFKWFGATPIGLSVLTFVQIAFLVDARRERDCRYGPLEYSLFAWTFPHLPAGPIVYHKDLIPQLRSHALTALDWRDVRLGLLVFFLGLAKKTCLADPLRPLADHLFSPGAGTAFGAAGAWLSATVYGLYVYFDFSAYSEMALGLGWLFGFQLPLNFLSPYKASNIAEFWQRWHISLSHWIRTYVFIPLVMAPPAPRSAGGQGFRIVAALILAFFLSGVWHGTTLNFWAWGLLHGVYLAVFHLWSQWRGRPRFPAFFGHGLTLTAVLVSWVVFRAENLGDAGRRLALMFAGGAGEVGGGAIFVGFSQAWLVGALGLVMVFILPNVPQLVFSDRGSLGEEMRPFPLGAKAQAVLGTLAAFAGITGMLVSRSNPFVYFQF